MDINQSPRRALIEFLDWYNEVNPINKDRALTFIKDAFGDYKNAIYQDYLVRHWYSKLDINIVDYSIYDDEYYFTDLWVCWVLYSRKYIRLIIKEKLVFDKLKTVKTIVDLGCGIGYTTAVLKQIFDQADVYGTNLEGTRQYRFCKEVGNRYNFKIISDIDNIKQIDLVFASEYFEHIENPIAHLVDIISKLKPKFLCIANSFNTISVGHFKWYDHGFGFIAQKDMSREFNKTLERSNYKRIKTKIWNNKPTIWELIN